MTRRVAIDAYFLAVMVDPTTPTRPAPAGIAGDIQDRLAYLIEALDRDAVEIVIPTPALAEVLSVAGREPGCKPSAYGICRSGRHRRNLRYHLTHPTRYRTRRDQGRQVAGGFGRNGRRI